MNIFNNPCIKLFIYLFFYLCAVQPRTSEAPSYWWIVGLVIAVLVLALAGMLAYLKVKGKDGVQQTWTLTDREDGLIHTLQSICTHILSFKLGQKSSWVSVFWSWMLQLIVTFKGIGQNLVWILQFISATESWGTVRTSNWLSCTSSGFCLKGSKNNIPVSTAEAERREKEQDPFLRDA